MIDFHVIDASNAVRGSNQTNIFEEEGAALRHLPLKMLDDPHGAVTNLGFCWRHLNFAIRKTGIEPDGDGRL